MMSTPLEILDAMLVIRERIIARVPRLADGREGSRDAADPAGSSHRARSASEAEPALRCEASARGVRRQSNNE